MTAKKRKEIIKQERKQMTEMIMGKRKNFQRDEGSVRKKGI